MNPRSTVFSSTLTRRNLLTLSAALGGTALLAACAGPSVGDAGQAAASTAPAQDWTGIKPASSITWWTNHPGASMATEQAMINGFQAANPGITVNMVTAGANYDEIAQKFQAAAGTDSVPDLVGASDVWWFRYMINQQIIPLDGLASHLNANTADFNTTLYDDYKYADSHWAMPYARSTPLFYYNKTLWSAAGLPDRAPATWDEFDQWAPKLSAVMNGAAPLGIGKGTSWAAWWFCNIMWGKGGAYSSDWSMKLDQPETLEAGNYLRRIINDDKSAAVSATDSTADFGAGLSACTVASTGSLTGILASAKFEVGTGFLPAGPKGAFTPTGGTGMAIASSKSPEQQLAAGMFLKYLTDAEQTATFSAATGYMPVRTSAMDGATMTAIYAKKPQFRTAVDQLKNARSQDWARSFVPSGDKYLTTALEQIMLQNSKAEDVFPKASADISTSYDQNVKPYL
ncbi:MULTISPECIES: ABC transporter substrate-binding protein [Subtercola]|uniref:ABC transporter substrate-binding protein n=1 Tax=Subtercola vilae TaxID=2056433 RepID=A0A4T2BFJ0_9MICO|nr:MULTISPECIES: ABC transporter substrate-binding protein [Subtercola]MEA9987148.1 ABC transporter substrate-binding protein [Subtercola sp. RTI3]TIH30213.1 ABC transporter substrate-binding protein [Subtercola vilae]